ncbi:MAG: hypothetical protein KDI13_04120 [Alphaproteobacteria bacterium]|nr:hypothetical protein [Alphaproteobacteria bacterium]
MSDKSGSPPCGIYVRIDDYKDMQGRITALRQMAMVVNRASGYEKNMHVVEFTLKLEHMQEIKDLIALMQNEGFVTILKDCQPKSEKDILGADGVLLDKSADIENIRSLLGDDPIIGLNYANEFQKPEQALDQDIDFIALPPDLGIVQWWAAQTDIPALVSGSLTNDTCGSFARAGASFVDVGAYIFGQEKGVMQGTINALYALDLAAEVQKKGGIH